MTAQLDTKPLPKWMMRNIRRRDTLKTRRGRRSFLYEMGTQDSS